MQMWQGLPDRLYKPDRRFFVLGGGGREGDFVLGDFLDGGLVRLIRSSFIFHASSREVYWKNLHIANENDQLNIFVLKLHCSCFVSVQVYTTKAGWDWRGKSERKEILGKMGQTSSISSPGLWPQL